MRNETAAWLRRYVKLRGHHMPHKSTASGQAKVEIDPVRTSNLYELFQKYVCRPPLSPLKLHASPSLYVQVL